MHNPELATERRKTATPGQIVAAGVLLVMLTLVATTTITSLPQVCSLCHQQQSVATAKSAHASTTCYDCHLANRWWGFADQKGVEFTKMYPTSLAGKGLTRPARAIYGPVCLACHRGILDRVTADAHLRIKHSACAKYTTCDSCHSQTAHVGAVRWVQNPTMDECVACHKKTGISTECPTCHVGKAGGSRGSGSAWQVTHGPDWRKTHGLGDRATCVTCHPAGFCAKCHVVEVPHGKEFGATHGRAAVADKAACLVCHSSEQAFCDKCHGFPMPHPDGFLEGHSEIASGASDPRCIRCHVDTDCNTCHANHVHPGGSSGVPVPWTSTPENQRP